MATETEQAACESERAKWAISKDDLRRVTRLQVLGSARLGGGNDHLSAADGNTSIGDNRLDLRLDVKVPFTYRRFGGAKDSDVRMQAEGVCLHSGGVHVLSRARRDADDDRTSRAEERTVWVEIGQITHVEQGM